jgi:hypothetical protein
MGRQPENEISLVATLFQFWGALRTQAGAGARVSRRGDDAGRISMSVRPEKASFGPGLRFRFFAILGIAALCPALGGIAKTLKPCPEPIPPWRDYHFRTDTIYAPYRRLFQLKIFSFDRRLWAKKRRQTACRR